MSIEINDRDVGGGPLTIPNLRPRKCKGEIRKRRGNGNENTEFVRQVTEDEHSNDCPSESGGSQSRAIVVGSELGSVDSF